MLAGILQSHLGIRARCVLTAARPCYGNKQVEQTEIENGFRVGFCIVAYPDAGPTGHCSGD